MPLTQNTSEEFGHNTRASFMFSGKPSCVALRFGAFAALLYLELISVVPSNSTRIHTWPWAFYTDILCLIPIVLLGTQLAVRAPKRFIGRWALFLAGIVVMVSVAHAPHPVFSFSVALLMIAGLSWTALVAERIASWGGADVSAGPVPLRAARWAGLLLSLPLFSGFILWIQDLHAGAAVEGWRFVFSHFEIYRNPHPFGHWNYIGGYAVLCVPWMVALTLTERGKMRMAWGAATMLASVVLISAFSRGAILGTAVGLISAIVFQIQRSRLTRRKAALALGTGFVAIAVLILANPRFRDFVLHPTTLLRPNEGDVQRLGMTEGGWLLFQKSPWLGHGPGMTPFVFPTVRASLVGGVETSFQLHNSALEIAVNLGVAGILAIFALLACVGHAIRRWLSMPFDEGDSALRPFRLASLYSLIGYGIVALTDYQLNVPAIVAVCGLHLGLLLGILSRRGSKKQAFENFFQRALGWVLLAAPLLACVVLFPEWKARHLFWQAWWVTPEKDRQQLLIRLHDAAEASPTNAFYRTMSGLQLAREAQKIPAGAGREALIKLARSELSLSLAVDPHQEPVEAALGWLAMDDAAKSAEKHFRVALDYIPDRDTLHLGLGLSQLAQGDEARAVHSLALECLVNPEFITSPFWLKPPLEPLRTRVLEEFVLLTERTKHDVNLPAWRQPHLTYLKVWVLWWATGATPTKDQLAGASLPQQEFFDALSDLERTTVQDRQFAALMRVYRDPARGAELEACRQPLSPDAISGAIARLKIPAQNFGTFLRIPAPNNEGVEWEEVSRLHYNIMARNLDGPGLPDLAPRPVDHFTHEFLDFAFPIKGMIPGKVLQNLESP